MKTLSLDNKKTKWKMSCKSNNNKSLLHKNALCLIKNIFSTFIILEEVEIQIKKNKKLYIDIFIPLLKIAIEVQGKQHFNFTKFFNNSNFDFIRQKINDRLKQEWAERNNITLIRLNYNETPSEWRSKLINVRGD